MYTIKLIEEFEVSLVAEYLFGKSSKYIEGIQNKFLLSQDGRIPYFIAWNDNLPVGQVRLLFGLEIPSIVYRMHSLDISFLEASKLAAQQNDYHKIGSLFSLLVTENMRRQYVGSALVYSSIGYLMEKNSKYVHVCTLPENYAARKFYTKIGFEPCHVREPDLVDLFLPLGDKK